LAKHIEYVSRFTSLSRKSIRAESQVNLFCLFWYWTDKDYIAVTKAAAAAHCTFVEAQLYGVSPWSLGQWCMRPRTALRVSVCRDIGEFILSPNRDFFWFRCGADLARALSRS